MTHTLVPDVRVNTGLTREATGVDLPDALIGMVAIAFAVCLWLVARWLRSRVRQNQA